MRSFAVLDVIQRSEAWRRARCGRLCASRAGDMLATIKNGEAAARRDLRVQLVVERLTGLPQDDGFVSADTQRGIELEAEARAAYEVLTGNMVSGAGFLAHDDLMTGGSPDGVIGDFEGLIEIKCPKSATHLRYLRARTLPAEYVGQVTSLLWLSGAQYCDFVSFDPRFPPPLRTFVLRVQRDEAAIKSYELALRMFLSEVDKDCAEVARLVKECAEVARLADPSLASVLA